MKIILVILLLAATFNAQADNSIDGKAIYCRGLNFIFEDGRVRQLFSGNYSVAESDEGKYEMYTTFIKWGVNSGLLQDQYALNRAELTLSWMGTILECELTSEKEIYQRLNDYINEQKAKNKA